MHSNVSSEGVNDDGQWIFISSYPCKVGLTLTISQVNDLSVEGSIKEILIVSDEESLTGSGTKYGGSSSGCARRVVGRTIVHSGLTRKWLWNLSWGGGFSNWARRSRHLQSEPNCDLAAWLSAHDCVRSGT